MIHFCFWSLISLIGRRENIAPDYPLTLLEGLTTITHYCLLESNRVRIKSHIDSQHLCDFACKSYSPVFSVQSLVACDPVDVRNARSAVIEALPHILSSMALLWGVIMKEEFQRRTSDAPQSSKHSSTSVYFKNTKVTLLAENVSLLILYPLEHKD